MIELLGSQCGLKGQWSHTQFDRHLWICLDVARGSVGSLTPLESWLLLETTSLESFGPHIIWQKQVTGHAGAVKLPAVPEQGDNEASKQKCCHRSSSGSGSQVEKCTTGKLLVRLTLGRVLNTAAWSSRPPSGMSCSLQLHFVLASRVSLGQGDSRVVLQTVCSLASWMCSCRMLCSCRYMQVRLAQPE